MALGRGYQCLVTLLCPGARIHESHPDRFHSAPLFPMDDNVPTAKSGLSRSISSRRESRSLSRARGDGRPTARESRIHVVAITPISDAVAALGAGAGRPKGAAVNTPRWHVGRTRSCQSCGAGRRRGGTAETRQEPSFRRNFRDQGVQSGAFGRTSHSQISMFGLKLSKIPSGFFRQSQMCAIHPACASFHINGVPRPWRSGGVPG